ncbi:MAG TPA: type 4a pilus biogenesis protein PilO [Candidatus Paceibacterota bacterium]
MAENFKNRLFFELGLTAGLLVFLLAASIFVKFSMERRAEEITEGKKELAARSSAVNSLAILKKEAERAATYSEILENILPTNEKLIDFRKDLRTLSAENKLDFTFSFGADTPKDALRPGSVAFQMTVGGDAQRFTEFLKKIEAMNYFFGFNAIDLSRGGPKFTASFGGKVYYR